MTSTAPTVVAIIAAYNEADVIGHVVSDLLAQNVRVYFLDDGSTDGTVEVIEPHVGHGVIAIERLRSDSSHAFEWTQLLQRKAQLAGELRADWFIHHDADEFRESPWPGVSVRDAIAHVDAGGYNAIDFRRLDFWPTDEEFRAGHDVRAAMHGWTEPREYDRLQIRCWKKTGEPVDLVSSGGHEVRFGSRHVFPIRFILRHYPIRSRRHGERKIFVERQPRFAAAERALGWHVQYDRVVAGKPFLPEPSALTRYDEAAVKLDVQIHHRTLQELERTMAADRAALAAERREVRLRSESLETAMATQAHELERCRADALDETERAEALLSRVAAMEDTLSCRDKELVELRRAVSDLGTRLEQVYASRSWRWSAPARALLRGLGGRTT